MIAYSAPSSPYLVDGEFLWIFLNNAFTFGHCNFTNFFPAKLFKLHQVAWGSAVNISCAVQPLTVFCLRSGLLLGYSRTSTVVSSNNLCGFSWMLWVIV